MADLCEEVEVETVPAVDLFEALLKKECRWGDLSVDLSVGAAAAAAAAAVAAYALRPDGTWRNLAVQSTLMDLFAQPFAEHLRTYDDEDFLDTRDLDEAAFVALLRWLYFEGWCVPESTLEFGAAVVEACPDTRKPRAWSSPSAAAAAAVAVAAAAPLFLCAPVHKPSRFQLLACPPAAAAAVAAKPRRITIPRFCKHSEACPDKETTCNYTHGDTIPCVDKVCGFDGRCAGDKRKTCIFMHPSEGQKWSPEQVVHR